MVIRLPMSATTFLLLSLLCLGASEAHFRGFRASDGSEFYAKSFVDVLRNAIEHKETNHVKEVISDSFLFIGCTRNVTKNQVLEMLKNVPVGAQVDFKFKSSHFIEPKKIEYTVAISGLGISLEANFVISAETSAWILVSGNVPKCPKTHHHHYNLLVNSAETIAKTFLSGFQSDLASGDATKIAKRFSDNFLYHGCKGDYTKAKVLALLASIPKDSKVSMTFQSAEFVNGKDVQYTILASGFGRAAFEAQFILTQESGEFVLIGGKVPTCPKSLFFLAADSAETLAKSFITGFLADIATRDAAIIGKRFSDSFLLHGCHDVYNKNKAIALFTSVPAGVQAALTFESASFVNGGEDVQFNAMASGLGRPTFEIEFLMRKENGEYVLVGEKVLNCPKSLFFLAADSAETLAKSFITGFVADIATRDAALIGKRFSDSFLLHGCHDVYNKDKAIALFTSVPAGVQAALTFESASFVNGGEDVQFNAMASGLGRPSFEVQFLMHKENGEYVLVGEKVLNCPKSLFFLAADSAETLAKSFITGFVADIATRDAALIGKRFSDSFLLHGCHDVYNKDKAIALFTSVPAGVQAALTFESASFVNGGEDVQFNAMASGLGRPSFEVQFLMRKENGEYVLVGEKVLNCPKLFRFYAALADSAETLAKSFITGFLVDIATRDAATIGKRFSDSFLLHGCHDVYNKAKAIALFTSVPAGVQAALTFESASFVNGGEDVQFNAMASGLGRPTFEIEFLMRKENGEYVLVGEKVLNCPKSLFFLAADSAETLAKSFITGFVADIATRDAALIGKRFSDSFLLHGCHDVYNKDKAIALFTSVPAGVQAALTFESASFVNGGEDVQFNAMASGLGRPSFEIEFLMRKENGEYVLVGEKVLNCPKRHFFVSSSSDNAEQAAGFFIKKLVDWISSKDQTSLSAIFADTFIFHGCKGDYTKAQVLAMLDKFPAGSKFTLTLKEAKYEQNNTALRYIVTADGFGRPAFEAEFLLKQVKNNINLIEGKVVKCAARRLGQFY